MNISKESYINALFTHICDECGAECPFDLAIGQLKDNYIKKWLPDCKNHWKEHNEQELELSDLLYVAMTTAFAVGFNVANEINRPELYKSLDI